jgi:uncharacterized membrane protein
MQSTARVAHHPIHPMLIPYPFAFLSGALAFDALALATGRPRYAQTAGHLGIAGCLSAVVAAVPGVIDYVGTVPAGAPRRDATRHALANLTGLALFTVAQVRRARLGGPDVRGVLALEVAGLAALALGGLLGSTLVYEHRIGVNDDAGGERASLAPRPVASVAAAAPLAGILS